jgi:Lytic polysaccharide mono-oxygenase, cellulose-degrading
MKRVPRLLIAVVCFGVATPAYAHFMLMQPASWANQSQPYGDPQKNAPCGNEGAVQTGQITEYKVGDMVTISFKETIPHPGHYRVLLAPDQASLPADPPVTADMQSDCGSTTITQNPTLPLLADGLLVHTEAAPLVGTQTIKVPLPPGMLCERCVLQIVEFMSNHGAPCYYHHCANIKISVNGPPPGTGGGGGGDAGVDGGTTSGGCSTGAAGASLLGGFAFGLLALCAGRRVSLRRPRD